MVRGRRGLPAVRGDEVHAEPGRAAQRPQRPDFPADRRLDRDEPVKWAVLVLTAVTVAACTQGIKDGSIYQDDTCNSSQHGAYSPHRTLRCEDVAAPSSSGDWRWTVPGTGTIH